MLYAYMHMALMSVNVREMVRKGWRTERGRIMAEIITFSKKAFNKGVNDALTFKPIRDAIVSIAKTSHHVHTGNGQNPMDRSELIVRDGETRGQSKSSRKAG